MLTDTLIPQTPRLTYHQLFDEVPCYISVQDRELTLLQANRRFKEEFGDQVGRPCYEVYKHRTERCEICPVAATFEDGQVHSSEEIVRSRLVEPIHVIVYTTPIRNESGGIEAVMEMSTDITEVRRMQQQLTSLGQLVASIAHSIKGLVMGLDGGMYVVNSGFARKDEAVVQKG